MHRRVAESGVTLIDAVVGTTLMLVIFLGIFAAFQLSVDVVLNNKARAGAVALADERMEYIRSLPYTSVGTVGGVPSGTLAQTESVSLNGVSYTRRTLVEYADDPKDGSGVSDGNGVTADYKTVKVDVSWISRTGARDIYLVTRLEPATGMESSVSGGTLVVNVLNAASQPLPNAQVTITNAGASPTVNLTTYSNASGVVALLGAPAAPNYSIVVTKTGYSTAQTYSATSQNTDPAPANLTVSNNQTTTGTFIIDLLSSMTIKTFSLATHTWADSFTDDSKIGPSTYIEIAGNQARLAGNQPWTSPGDLRSQAITPVALSRWGTFSWNDTRPSATTITYHVYYPAGSGAALVPDSALSGNSSGFGSGTSVDLSGIPANTYPSLILEAYMVALDPNAPSPSVQNWDLTYQSGQSIAVPFTMLGAKTIGSGPGGILYKYNQSLATDSSGSLAIPNLEWDTYTTSVAPSTGYDIVSSCPPQPIYLAPNTALTTQLFFSPHTANSLLVDVRNSAGVVLSGARTHLTKGGSYDTTVVADACGQAFFSSLTNGNYAISVSATGYQTYSSSGVNVSGTSRLSVILN